MGSDDRTSRGDAGGVDQRDFARDRVRDRRRPAGPGADRLVFRQKQSRSGRETPESRRTPVRRRRGDGHSDAMLRQGGLRFAEPFQHEDRVTIVRVRVASAEAGMDHERKFERPGRFRGDLEQWILVDAVGMMHPADDEISDAAVIRDGVHPLSKVRGKAMDDLFEVHEAGTRSAPRPPSIPTV